MGFWTALAVALVVNVVAYLLMPKPKRSSPQTQDLREPTARADQPRGRVWGEMTITSPNVNWYGDIDKREYEVKA